MFLFANALVLTINKARDVLLDGAVLVDGDRIVDIGDSAILRARHPSVEIIDCSGQVVMPGMVNTHTHLFQTLLKGLGDDMDLKQWFSCMTGPAAEHLTVPDIHAAAVHGCVESIRAGVTTLVDFQYVHVQPGMTDAVVEAFTRTGMRGFVCRGFLNTGIEHGVPARLIEETTAVMEDTRAAARRHNREGARVQVGIAPCMIWTVDEAGFRLARELADELGLLITTHLAETEFELQCSNATYGCTDTALLDRIGFLGPDVLAVHCVNCSSHDIALLRKRDTKISHNPCSNLYLASGIAPIPEMIKAGLTVSLASDGPASSNNHSIFQAMKFAALIQKGLHRDATIITAEAVLEMATIGGARAVGLEGQIGSLEVGKKADLIVIGIDGPALTPFHNAPSALVYSALGHEVVSVMIDGSFVMRDGVVLSVDEVATRMTAQHAAEALVERAGIGSLRNRGWNNQT